MNRRNLTWLMVLATLLIARAAIRRRRPRDDSGFVILALAGAFAAGCALGTSAAGRARSACATELETGDLVRIEGLTREHRDTGSAARLTLRDVAIIEARTGRTCAVDGLVVRLDRSPEDLAAGSLVSVRGEWIRMGARTKWPRRPARLGIVLGRLQSAGESRSARPDRGSPVRDVLARARARVYRSGGLPRGLGAGRRRRAWCDRLCGRLLSVCHSPFPSKARKDSFLRRLRVLMNW